MLKSILKSPWLPICPLLLALALFLVPCSGPQPDMVVFPRATNFSTCCLMLSEDGKLVGWGDGRGGHLGGLFLDCLYPLRRTVLDRVESVHCAQNGTVVLALREDHSLYGIGRGAPRPEGSSGPVLLMEHVISADIASRIGAVTEDGTLWIWDDSGTPVSVMDGVRKIRMGGCGEGFAITDTGDLFLIRFPDEEDPSAPETFTPVFQESGVQDVRCCERDWLLLTEGGQLRVLMRDYPSDWNPNFPWPMPHAFREQEVSMDSRVSRLTGAYTVEDETGTQWHWQADDRTLEKQERRMAVLTGGVGLGDMEMLDSGIFSAGWFFPCSYRFLTPLSRNLLLAAVVAGEAVIWILRKKYAASRD